MFNYWIGTINWYFATNSIYMGSELLRHAVMFNYGGFNGAINICGLNTSSGYNGLNYLGNNNATIQYTRDAIYMMSNLIARSANLVYGFIVNPIIGGLYTGYWSCSLGYESRDTAT